MANIYKLVIAKGPSPRWSALPEDIRNDLWSKSEKRFKEVGAERILMVDSSWASEGFPRFFVEVYPTIEALQKFTAYLSELHFLQHFDVRTVIGMATPSDPVITATDEEAAKTKIYKLVVATGHAERWNALPETEQNTLWEKAEASFKEVGGERVLWVDSSWSSEEYPGFFVETYPNIEALQKFTAYLHELRFLQYFDVITLVGKAYPF